ncbi:hypothetical protein HMPREF9413_1003 [Paenibacillus sp. HGF7]|nr:hypothetical protein HMPREF9413_1003 [Paenibacillus sp. HGF7]
MHHINTAFTLRVRATFGPGNKERGSNCRDTSAPTNRIAAGSKLP